MLNYTVKVTDRLLRFDTTKDDVTVTLLPFAQTPNAPYEIHRTSTGDGHTVTIQVDGGTSDYLLPDGTTALVLNDTSYAVYIKIPASGLSPAYVSWGSGGGTGDGGGGTPVGPAPPVSVDAVAEVIFRNNGKIEVDVDWTPASSATTKNFTGVKIYLEDPDISSGTQAPLDVAVGTALDGSAQVSGQWEPVYQSDSFVNPNETFGTAVVFPDSKTTYTQSRNVRIYLNAYGPGGENKLVRANDPTNTPTPNIMVEIPIGPGQGESGMEWAFLVTEPDVQVVPDYNRPDPQYSLVFTYIPPDPTAPVPPGVNRFGGVRIVYVYYDHAGNLLFPGADSSIDVPVAQAESGYSSPAYPASAGGGKFRVYFCSEDDSTPLGMHVNSLVEGVTPKVDVVVPPVITTAIDVGNFMISGQKAAWQIDGTLIAQATFAWTLPPASAIGNYGGVRLYLVNVTADTGNDGSTPLTAFPQALSATQANIDTGLTLYETPPAQPEVWTVAAISVDTSGGLADIPADFGKSDFHSPYVLWHISQPPPGAPLVTINAGAQATPTQSLSTDGVGMVSFQVGPWTNPTDAGFGGAQVAMVINKDPNSVVYWSVPLGATSFTTPSMPSFGNIGANVPVDFYLVSDDPKGHKNQLVLGSGGTPRIASTYVPAEGAVIPARSGWFDPSQFKWVGNGFQAYSFSASVIQVGKTLVVGGAPASFGGSDNGQIAVLDANGKLLDWLGQQQPQQGSGAPLWGAWLGQVWIGGTNPLDAPVFVDNQGIIEVGGIAAAKGSAYPYISIRDSSGYEKGRIGASLTVPSGSPGDGTGGSPSPQLAQLTTGAWFTEAAFGGSNLANWNILIAPTTKGNPLGSDFIMRNIQLLSIDYAAQISPPPGQAANEEYKLEFGNSVWTGYGTTGQWQFPGIHLYEVDNQTNPFGSTLLSRGLVLRGHANQGNPVLASLVTFNGNQAGADYDANNQYNFWGELSMYSPLGSHIQTVYLTSGGSGTGSAWITLRDVSGNLLFGTDTSGACFVKGVLQGAPTPAQTPVNAFAYAVAGYGTVIDQQGNWKGPAIAAPANQTPWQSLIDGNNFPLQNVKQVTASAYYITNVTTGAAAGANGTPAGAVIRSDGTFWGSGVDVGGGGIGCSFLTTLNRGGSQEIDCGYLLCTASQGASGKVNANTFQINGQTVIDSSRNVGCYQLYGASGQVLIDNNGNFKGGISAANLTCTTLTLQNLYVGSFQCVSGNGTWLGSVQCNDHVYGKDFGIEGVAYGYPPGTNPANWPAGTNYSTFKTGDSPQKTVYVIGGIIVWIQ